MAKFLSSAFSKCAVGFVLGAAAAPFLKGKQAKKLYTHAATGVMLARDAVMTEFEKVQASAMDIITDAKINCEEWYAKRDAAECECECDCGCCDCCDESEASEE